MSMLRRMFARSQRLTRKSQFDAIYKAGRRRTVGPLLIHALENKLEFSRLGLSVPKRVGNAVKRNSIRRRCREAFRISQHALPTHLDVVLTVRQHEILSTQEYAELLQQGIAGYS